MKEIDHGNQARIFLSDNGTIIKRYRENNEGLPQTEAASLQLMAHFRIAAPRFLGFRKTGKGFDLEMARVDGIPLEDGLWMESGAGEKVGATLGKLHAEIHSKTLGKMPVKDLQSPPEASLLFSTDVETVRRVDKSIDAKSLLSLSQNTKVVCHGDFHPSNIMGTSESPTVIDWCDSYIGSRESDVALSIVRLRTVGLSPVATPMEASRFEQNLVQLESAYLSSYLEQAELNRPLVEIWGKVVAEATKRRRGNQGIANALIERFEPRWP